MSSTTSPRPKQFPDHEIHLGKITFGEEARKSIKGKEKDEEKNMLNELQQSLCALLNSGGGVISVDIKNEGYDESMGFGHDVEEGLRKLITSSEPVQDFIKLVHEDQKMLFFVRSWNRSNVPLCSINTGIKQRSGTSVVALPNGQMSNFIRNKLKVKYNDEKDSSDDDDEPLQKRPKRMSVNNGDTVYDMACQFYEQESVEHGQQVRFGESDNIELKDFRTDRLKKRLGECLPKYISAFANTGGGILFIGVNDKTKIVTGCGAGMDRNELERVVSSICEKSSSRAFHFKTCSHKENGNTGMNWPLSDNLTQQTTFAPEYRIINITQETPLYVIGVKIPSFCCVVFEDNPQCWQIKNGENYRLNTNEWLQEMQHSDQGI